MDPEQAAKHALLEQDIVSIELQQTGSNDKNRSGSKLKTSTKVLVNQKAGFGTSQNIVV